MISEIAGDGPNMTKLRHAFISVSDKTDLDSFAGFLIRNGVRLTATGGTGEYLRSLNIEFNELSEITGFRELLGGRVKSLHPTLHAAILADRNNSEHLRELSELGIEPIDLVVGSLYPFDSVSRQDWNKDAEAMVDIGGPAMLRAAAKNFQWVTVIHRHEDYENLKIHLQENHGVVGYDHRRRQAASVFSKIASYDASIARVIDEGPPTLPSWSNLTNPQRLRYGENPHQNANLYSLQSNSPSNSEYGFAASHLLAGPELGYNNIIDADAAVNFLADCEDLKQAACVIIKHGTPCGAAVENRTADAFARALATDPVSAFGGVIGLNRDLDAATAQLISECFVELVVAPGASDEAVRMLQSKKKLRILTMDFPKPHERSSVVRSVYGGFLVQSPDCGGFVRNEMQVVTHRQPSPGEWSDLRFAWRVAQHARSNSVAVVGSGAVLGIGSGRTSRVDAAKDAVRNLQKDSKGPGFAAASDGFFPFADSIDVLAEKCVRSIIQPGGSIRDAEVIARADQADIAMVMTGRRHFKH